MARQTKTNEESENRDVLLPEATFEGELAIDVYQTPTEIVVQSPIAGVQDQNIDVGIEGDMLTIRGTREREETVGDKDYFCQECYWGGFSRTVSLPTGELDVDKAVASMKNGILTVRIPKTDKKRSKKLKIQSAP